MLPSFYFCYGVTFMLLGHGITTGGVDPGLMVLLAVVAGILLGLAILFAVHLIGKFFEG